jgi:hypothetical protein
VPRGGADPRLATASLASRFASRQLDLEQSAQDWNLTAVVDTRDRLGQRPTNEDFPPVTDHLRPGRRIGG